MAHCCSRPRRKGEPAACEERPNVAAAAAYQTLGRPLLIQPASQKLGKQRKEGRLAACSLACFSRSWRKVYSQLSACSSLLSIGRSMDLPRTTRRTNERTNERADIHGNDACDGGGGGQKKASVVHPEAFLESRAGSSSNGVSGPRLLLPPLLLTVARSSSLLLLLLWLVSSRRDHGGLSTQSGRQTGSAAIDFCP
jgi:hypothetical protein